MDLTKRVYDLYAKLPRGVAFLPDRQLAQRPPEGSWATPDQILADEWVWDRSKMLLGTFNGKLIGTNDNRHLCLISGNRGGKTSTVLKPCLFSYPGNIVVCDPKGELALATAAHRKDVLKQDVYVLDPFNISKVRPDLRAQFNPLWEIDPASTNAVDDAAMLADAMIVETGGDSGNGSYWSMAARNLVRGLILYTLMHPDRSQHTLDVMTRKLSEFETAAEGMEVELTRNGMFREMMAAGNAFRGVVAATGAAMLAKSTEEGANVLSTVVENLAFLDSPALQDNFQQSDFRIGDLVKKPMTVYLCLDAGRMATHFRWLRMFIDLALVQLEREREEKEFVEGAEHRIIFMCEEFPVLQHMKRLSVAAGLMSSMGIRLWIVLQNLGQLKHLYKDNWETFLGNCGVLQCFSLNDMETLDYVSKRLGETSFWMHSYSQPSYQQRLEGQSPQTTSWHTSPLLTPSELAMQVERDGWQQVIIRAGYPPMMIHRLKFETVEKLRAGMLS